MREIKSSTHRRDRRRRRRGPDRRRSLRVQLGEGLRAILVGVGPVACIDVSLGGARIEVSVRLYRDDVYRLALRYQGATCEMDVRVRQSKVKELYYDSGGVSHVRYLTRLRFTDPSIDALNFLYRVMGDHWYPEL